MKNYKKLLLAKGRSFRKLSWVLLFFLSSSKLSFAEDSSSKFQHVKDVVFKEAYTSRPNYKVSTKLFGPRGNNPENKLLQAAKRSLNEPRDLIRFPAKQKLFNANGICFSGVWQIDESYNKDLAAFTGLFAPNTKENIIARVSVALSGTKQKHKRSFGMAIKFFPSNHPHSLNAFVLNSFGGVRVKHALDLSFDNQPSLGSLPNIASLPTVLRIKSDLEKADLSSGAKKAQFAFRPISHLANYDNSQIAHSPQWLRLEPLTSQRVDLDDFRDELSLDNYTEQEIIYRIQVATKAAKKSQAVWQTIGKLTFSESIVSPACDQQLHFQHPTLAKE